MKIEKRILLSLLCIFSIVLTVKAQDKWPFSVFLDPYSLQNVTINAGTYIGEGGYIGNIPSSPFYGKSNVVLNSGAKLNMNGWLLQINPNTTFKVGSLFSMVYYYDTPVGNEPIKITPRGGWVENYRPNKGDTVIKYAGGVGGNSDWGLHLNPGSLQFGYVNKYSESAKSTTAWRMYNFHNYVDQQHQYDYFTFALVSMKTSSDPVLIDLIYLDSSGSMGIGSYPSSVEFSVYGNMLANSYLKSSDRRLKHDIRPVSNSSNVVCSLMPKKYLKKATNKQEAGFLAQEVENIIPDLVYKDQTSGEYSVDYQGVLPFILEAIKEQQKIIDNNQVQIDKMKDLLK